MSTFLWWRSWHGAPTDTKYLVIASKAGVKVGLVSAVMWALLDYASQHKNRGSVEGFDSETYSVYSGFPEGEINAVLQAMREKGMILEDRLVNWEKRQPKREDDSHDRVTRFREKQRNVTQSNVSEKSVTVDSTLNLNLISPSDLSLILKEGQEIQKQREEEEQITAGEEEEPETEEEATDDHPLSLAFEKVFGILPYKLQEWVQACREMTLQGIQAEEMEVIKKYMDSEGLSYSGPWSIQKTAIYVHQRRKEGKPIFNRKNGNRAQEQEQDPNRYISGELGQYVEH